MVGSLGANGFHGLTLCSFTVITSPRPSAPSRYLWNTTPRCSAVLAAIASRRRRAHPPSGRFSGRTRSSFRQITTVPGSLASRSTDLWITGSGKGSTTSHSSHSAIRSRSSIRIWTLPGAARRQVTTVTDRHCDSEAVLSPRPYRPRSLRPYERREPYRSASTRPLPVIPSPSSEITTYESSPANSIETSICEAPAMTLLSTMSATAAGKSYPISRSDSVSRAADGVMAADFRGDIRQPPHVYQGLRPGSHMAPATSHEPARRAGSH